PPPFFFLVSCSRVALMAVSSAFVKTPVQDGLSTTPIEYRIVQQHKAKATSIGNDNNGGIGTVMSIPGVLVLSEGVSCLSPLRGCLAVNPWKVEAVSETIAKAVKASDREKISWHQ
ncbi:unnamed protein product, partial [Sphacelaria rigidula]